MSKASTSSSSTARAQLAAAALAASLSGSAGAQTAPPGAPALSASAAERISNALSPAPTRADYAPLFKARRFAQVERMADARLAVDAKDVVSLVAKSSAITAQQNPARLDEAAKLAERAIEANPMDSNAHEALGDALGTKAIAGGVASALGYATKIRDAYKKAVELNPNNHAARFSLLQYYSAAPGFLGGGKARAQELAASTHAQFPESAKLMYASLAIGDKDPAKAEQLAMSALLGPSDDFAEQFRAVMGTVGSQYLAAQRFADAERVFKELARRFPQHELGLYGQARTLAAQGKHAEAVPLYDQAQSIFATASVHYRKAQSLQALGQTAKAVGSFEAALAARPPLSKNQLADANEQLQNLKK